MRIHILNKIKLFFPGSFIDHWIEDNNLKNLLKNATTLLSGNMIAWVIGLLTLALTARILGPSEFGILVLIATYITLVGTFVTFKSWQTVIKYGSDALQEKNSIRFKQIIKFCTTIDFLTAIFGVIIAITIAIFFGNIFSIKAEILNLTILYSITLLFDVSGTPIGVLRLFGKFQLISIQNIISSFIKLIGILIVFFLAGANFFWIICVWIFTSIAANLLLLYIGWNELKKHGYHTIYFEPLSNIAVNNPGIWGFIMSTNLTSSVRLGKEMDIMIIGGILGAEAVGLYKIAKQIAAIPAMMSDPLYEVIYPDLSKLWARKDLSAFKRLMFRSSLFAGCGGIAFLLIFYLFGQFFIQLLFGSAYVPTFPISCVYMIGMIIAIFCFPLSPALLAMGKPSTSFWIQGLSTICFLIFLFIFVNFFGIIGAGIAIIIFYLFMLILMSFLVNGFLNQQIMGSIETDI